MTLLSSLTPEQRKVVEYAGHALLTACPGSGKTRTVAAKIAYELSIREPRSKRWILAITHTNVAAEEILSRLDKAGIESSQVWVGTVHSFCLEWMLKPYAGLEPRISRGFRIVNEYEQRVIEDEVKRAHGISGWDPLPVQVDSNLCLAPNIPPRELAAAKEYHARLDAERLLDFSLILSLASRIANRHPFIGSRLGQLFEQLIVDEYQDLSQLQYDIVSNICRHGLTKVMFVGDVDQAIYTTLGAVVKQVAELESELHITGVKPHSLSGCFRSAQRIIDFYRSFQDQPIEIVSRLPEDEQVATLTYRNDVQLAELAANVAALISGYIAAGIREDEIVVLAPQWPDAASLGRQLQALLPDVPFDSPNSSPLPRSFENRWNSFIRLCSTPITPESYSRRQRIASSVCNDLRQLQFDLHGFSRPYKSVLSAVNTLAPPGRGTIAEYVGQAVLEFCGLMGFSLEDHPAAQCELEALQLAISSRVQQLGLQDEATQLARSFSRQPSVRVTSYHSVKGEEFNVVIATGLVAGKIPHWNDIIDRDPTHTNYVARRLLYVACSRAKYHLHLISEVGHKTRRGKTLDATPQVSCALHLLEFGAIAFDNGS